MFKNLSQYIFSFNRYEEKKQKGKIKPFSVHLLPPSKQNRLREKWRNAQKKHRKRKHELDALMNLTPPSLEVSLNEDDISPPNCCQYAAAQKMTCA